MHLRWSSFALSLALCGTVSTAWAERPDQLDTTRSDRVTLEYTFERGTARTWALSANERVEGLEGTDGTLTLFSIGAPVLWEVQTRDAEGISEVAMSIGEIDASLQIDGEDESTREILTALSSARFSLRMHDNGDNEEFTASVGRDSSQADAGAFVSDLLRAAWVEFPSESVAIGDSWLQTIPLAMTDTDAGVVATLTVRYTLAGFALVNGTEQAVIDAELTTTIDGQQPLGDDLVMRIVGRGNGTGYVIFDHRAGQLTEIGTDNGVVLTFVDPNDQRTTLAISSDATLTGLAPEADEDEDGAEDDE